MISINNKWNNLVCFTSVLTDLVLILPLDFAKHALLAAVASTKQLGQDITCLMMRDEL